MQQAAEMYRTASLVILIGAIPQPVEVLLAAGNPPPAHHAAG
jgi:hypothetical protein